MLKIIFNEKLICYVIHTNSDKYSTLHSQIFDVFKKYIAPPLKMKESPYPMLHTCNYICVYNKFNTWYRFYYLSFSRHADKSMAKRFDLHRVPSLGTWQWNTYKVGDLLTD